MTNQAAVIFININSRSSTQIIMTFVAAGEALKAARCVYGAAVTGDGPILCFNHQHWLYQQMNLLFFPEKCCKAARESHLQLFIPCFHDGGRRRRRRGCCSSGSIHFKSVWKERQQWRPSERGLSCPNIRSPDFLLYIPWLESGAALPLSA